MQASLTVSGMPVPKPCCSLAQPSACSWAAGLTCVPGRNSVIGAGSRTHAGPGRGAACQGCTESARLMLEPFLHGLALGKALASPDAQRGKVAAHARQVAGCCGAGRACGQPQLASSRRQRCRCRGASAGRRHLRRPLGAGRVRALNRKHKGAEAINGRHQWSAAGAKEMLVAVLQS